MVNGCLICKNITNFVHLKIIIRMKRLAIVAALTVAAALFSHSTMAQGLRFGIYFDPQISWFSSDSKVFTPNGPGLVLLPISILPNAMRSLLDYP